MFEDAYIAFNQLPELPPDNEYWRTVEVYERVSRANRHLAELKGRIAGIPNPEILINTLSLQEAKGSSSIENVFTTNDKLYKALSVKAEPDAQTKEVLRYSKALIRAACSIRDNKEFILKLYRLYYIER